MTPARFDAIIRYHLVIGRRIGIESWGGHDSWSAEIFETGLECYPSTSPPPTSNPHTQPIATPDGPFCYLSPGSHQVVKVYRNGDGSDLVFDGELPEAHVVAVIKTRNGSLVLLSRTLLLPGAFPEAVAMVSPLRAVLDCITNKGVVDYRTTPLTLFVPRITLQLPSQDMLDALAKDPQIAGAHVVLGVHYSHTLVDGITLKTITNFSLLFRDNGKTCSINNVPVGVFDVITNFGVVHLIDGELVKSSSSAERQSLPPAIPIPSTIPPIRSSPRPQPSPLSTPLMVAGGVAIASGIIYVAWKQFSS